MNEETLSLIWSRRSIRDFERREIKDDCALIKNIEKMVELIKELKEFTTKFVMENISKK